MSKRTGRDEGDRTRWDGVLAERFDTRAAVVVLGAAVFPDLGAMSFDIFGFRIWDSRKK